MGEKKAEKLKEEFREKVHIFQNNPL